MNRYTFHIYLFFFFVLAVATFFDHFLKAHIASNASTLLRCEDQVSGNCRKILLAWAAALNMRNDILNHAKERESATGILTIINCIKGTFSSVVIEEVHHVVAL